MADHCAHVKYFYQIAKDFAEGQLIAMCYLKGEIPAAKDNIPKIEKLIKELDSKLQTVQNGDSEGFCNKTGTVGGESGS